jgi:hypothetical protein
MVPHLVRGAAVLTRVLRMKRITRPAVRVVPTVVRRTVKILRRGAAKGLPITRRRAAATMASQTRKVLGSPRMCAVAVKRNLAASRRAARQRPAREL